MSVPTGVRRDWGWLPVLTGLGFALYPLSRPGLPSVADAMIHLVRTAEWVRVWQDGVLYPRWAPNLAFGYGFPLFIFAPPLPYAVAGGLHLLGAPLALAVKMLPLIGFVVAALGVYLFVRDVWGPWAGIVAGAAFAYAPFLLREAYIYGGNYPQFLAIASFPWVLWGFRRVVLRGSSGDVLIAGVAYAVPILSHNFHAFVFTPVVAVYVLGLAILTRRWMGVVRAAAGGLLGAMLSACLWLPALYERQWTLAHEGFYVARSNFALRFLDWRELLAGPVPLDARAANPYMPFALGWGALALAAVAVLTLIVFPRRFDGMQRFHFAFFFALLIAVVFMMLPASQPAWENLPLLAVAEFPWRLMGLAALALGVLAGGSVALLEHRAAWLWTAAAVGAVVLTTAVYTYPPRPFEPLGTPSLADMVRYERDTQTIGTTTLGEYLPIWVQEAPLSSPMVDDYLAGRPLDKADPNSLPAGARVRTVEHNAVSTVFHVESPEAWTMRINTFFYPGWRATVDDEAVDIRVLPPFGLIGVEVPAGEHTVALRFGNIRMRTAANVVSGAALAVCVALGLARPARRERRGRRPLGLRAALLPAGLFVLLLGVRAAVIDPHTGWFRRESPPEQALPAEHPTRVDFDGRIALLGYTLHDEPARQGGSVRVSLYWEALEPIGRDYSTFAHLDVPPDLTTRAQSDHVHPGDARAQIDVPVRNWAPGRYVRDEHTVPVPADMPPVACALRVGLYDREGNRLPVRDESGRPVGDAVLLQPLHVLPARPPDMGDARRAAQRFGERVELVGYRLEGGEVEPGGMLRLHLYWRATAPPEDDYTVFVHLLDGAGQLAAQADGPPLGGAYPTSWWWPGQLIEDVRQVRAPDSPGAYRVAVGLYEPAGGRRLPTGSPDDALTLEVRVQVKDAGAAGSS